MNLNNSTNEGVARGLLILGMFFPAFLDSRGHGALTAGRRISNSVHIECRAQ
jgi:hypothetical protein